MIISISVAIVNWLISPFTLGLFTGDKAVIALGSSVMFIAIILEFGRTTNLVIINSMKAAGDVKFPTALAIFFNVAFECRARLAARNSFRNGTYRNWIAMAADEIFQRRRCVYPLDKWAVGEAKGVVLEDKTSPTETAEVTA